MIEQLLKLNDTLLNLNFKYKIISAKHIPEIKQEIKQLYIDKKINKKIYNYASKYYQFNINKDAINESYILIVAIPQKISIVTFNIKEKNFDFIIPPTYIYKKNQNKIYKILLKIFKDNTKINYAYLPKKLIAARSGLAKYGRNNICYVDSMGSFNRLELFYIDFPLEKDNWIEKNIMKECNNCNICINACPNKCIRKNEFVIKAENCLTYFNENLNEFPDWLKIKSHNALVGCMICQNVCPINKKYKKNKERVITFSKEESEIILQGNNENKIPPKIKRKLKIINMDEYLNILPRNIKILL